MVGVGGWDAKDMEHAGNHGVPHRNKHKPPMAAAPHMSARQRRSYGICDYASNSAEGSEENE